MSDTGLQRLISIAPNLSYLNLDANAYLTVKSLEVISQVLSDLQLPKVKAKKLVALSLAYCNFVMDETCSFFSNLPQLEYLALSGTVIAHPPITNPALRTICLSDCDKLTEVGVEAVLSKNPKLIRLECINSPMISSTLKKDLRVMYPNTVIAM